MKNQKGASCPFFDFSWRIDEAGFEAKVRPAAAQRRRRTPERLGDGGPER
jgi:hypothetical protein